MSKILVSACLLGCKVRYDGNDLPVDNEAFKNVIATYEIISFCPEVAGGLPTPRIAAEICGGAGSDVLEGRAKILGKDGSDVTAPFIKGAKLALQLCQENDIKQAILTESSPSCGSATIYNGKFAGEKITGQGVTCATLEKHGVKVVSQYGAAKFIN